MEFWNHLDGSTRTYIMLIAGFMVVYLAVMLVYMKNKKNAVNKWLAENPTAVKVYLDTKSGLIHSNTLTIISVDLDRPVHFTEGMKRGFYLLPGKHVVESTISTTRPGLLHRTVTTQYGPTKQEIEVEAGKTYDYSFDLKGEQYEFSEI